MDLNEKLDHAWDWMQTTRELTGVTLDFTQGFWAEMEAYKYQLYKQAKENISRTTIMAVTPGSGRILQEALNALNFSQRNGGGSLVDWRAYTKLRDNGSDAQFEAAVKDLFNDITEANIASTFQKLKSAKNSTYQIAAFLFFVQNRNRFLPITQDRFDTAFRFLGLNLKTSFGDGETYLAFLALCGQVADWLKTKGAKFGESRRQDAHSFLYWLGTQVNEYKPGTILEVVDAKISTNSIFTSTKPNDGPNQVEGSTAIVEDDRMDTDLEPKEDEDGFIAEHGVMEGQRKFRQHIVPERDPSIVKRKKLQVLQEKGCLECEACMLDFEKIYGPLGKGFIECHHVNLVSGRPETGTLTTLDELALLCSNCHRMVHRSKPMLSIEELKVTLAIVKN